MNLNRKLIGLWVICLAVMLFLAACGGDEPAVTPEGSGGGLSDVEKLVADYDLEPLSAEDQKYVINMGYYDCDHMTAACIGQDTGIFKALGLTVNLTGNGNVPEAMSAGKMDVAYAGWLTTLSAAPQGTPLFIAAQNHTGGSEYLVVSNEIKSPEELLGKKISLGADPETKNLNWVEFASEFNIPIDASLYDNYIMSDRDEYFAFKTGNLDAYICCDPWGSMAEYEGTGWSMIRQDTDRDNGLGTCCKVAMHRDFAEQHPELAKRVLLAHCISIQYMYEHPYKAAEIFAENYGVPLEVGLMTMWKKTNFEGRTITWEFKLDELNNQLATMREYGVRNDVNSVNVEEYCDLSYFEACGAKDWQTYLSQVVDPVFPKGMTYDEWRVKAVEVDNIIE